MKKPPSQPSWAIFAALKTQYEELKAAGEAKKTEIAEARKAAQAKAVAERTAIVEKAEALAASLGDNTLAPTADKFRNLFDEWQNHQRTTVRIDKPEAEAVEALLRRPYHLQPGSPQVGSGSRQRAYSRQGSQGSDYRRGQSSRGFHRLG